MYFKRTGTRNKNAFNFVDLESGLNIEKACARLCCSLGTGALMVIHCNRVCMSFDFKSPFGAKNAICYGHLSKEGCTTTKFSISKLSVV